MPTVSTTRRRGGSSATKRSVAGCSWTRQPAGIGRGPILTTWWRRRRCSRSSWAVAACNVEMTCKRGTVRPDSVPWSDAPKCLSACGSHRLLVLIPRHRPQPGTPRLPLASRRRRCELITAPRVLALLAERLRADRERCSRGRRWSVRSEASRDRSGPERRVSWPGLTVAEVERPASAEWTLIISVTGRRALP